MFAKTVVALALAAFVLADPYITSPVDGTSWNGGQSATVNWIDSGKGSDLKTWGACGIYLEVGNAMQQTALQTIVDSVDVSTTSAVQFNVDANAGATSGEYFIRIQSKSLMQGQYPALAFSAKFQLNGMKGSFNSSVQAQIDGQSTAPIASPTGSSSNSSSSSTKPTSSSSSSSSKSTASPTSSSSPNGAAGMFAPAPLGLAALVAFAGALLL